MCKSIESQNVATDNFFAKLRGEVYSHTKAIFEFSDDGRADLIGFAALIEDSVLTFFSVEPDNSVRCADCIARPAMGNRGIAAYFGGDYAEAC